MFVSLFRTQKIQKFVCQGKVTFYKRKIKTALAAKLIKIETNYEKLYWYNLFNLGQNPKKAFPDL